MKDLQKGSVNVWLIVIIAVLVIVVGYFVFIKKPTTINQQAVPSIKVLVPNGGETWRIGSEYTISFSGTGDLGTKTIRLNRYSDDGVRVGEETIGTTESDTFKFTVPAGISTTNGNAGRYKIQVIVNKYNSGLGVADESDDYFKIFPKL